MRVSPPGWLRGKKWRFEAVWERLKPVSFQVPKSEDYSGSSGDTGDRWAFDEGIIMYNGSNITDKVKQEEHSRVNMFVSIEHNEKRQEYRDMYSILCHDNGAHVIHEWRRWGVRVQYRRMRLERAFTLGVDGFKPEWVPSGHGKKEMEIPWKVVG